MIYSLKWIIFLLIFIASLICLQWLLQFMIIPFYFQLISIHFMMVIFIIHPVCFSRSQNFTFVHRYAIYIPLFLPVMLPIVLSFGSIYKHFQKRRNKVKAEWMNITTTTPSPSSSIKFGCQCDVDLSMRLCVCVRKYYYYCDIETKSISHPR